MASTKLFNNAKFAKRIKKRTVRPTSYEISERPRQIVATDLSHFHDQNCQLIVDDNYDSKYLFIRRLKEFSSQEVINVTKQIFGEQRVPERVISDNRSHYSYSLFQAFSRYPHSNKMAERCLQSVESVMKKAAHCNRDINMVLPCLRATQINYFIPLPDELMYNRKPVSNIPVKCTNHQANKNQIGNRLYQTQSTQTLYHD